MISLLLGVSGCLPQGAVGTRDQLEADVFEFRAAITAQTEGAIELAPFTWTVEGKLLSSHARSFRDGSLGRLLRWEDVRGRVERDGAPPVDTPAGLSGAWMELRAFPRGTVLKVEPLAPWAGADGHAELLDAVWTALSPDIPTLKVGETDTHPTSWPVWVRGGLQPIVRFSGAWTLEERRRGQGRWRYEGPLLSEAPRFTMKGTARGTVTLDRDAPRLVEHTLTQDRTVTTLWGPGQVVQALHVEASVRWVASVPAPVPESMLAQDDPVADAEPLKLPDGRVLPRDATARPDALPFLLVPDDIGAADRATLVARLAPPGSIPAEEASP